MLLSFDKLEDKDIIVTQIKSESRNPEDQKQTLKGLGLKGVNKKSELKCTKSIYGMLHKVKHLIKVEIK